MIRELTLALRACAVTFVLCAVAYPAVVVGAGAVAVSLAGGGEPDLCADDRTVIGSELIAQQFESDRYFHPRPSAADYKADAAGGLEPGDEQPRPAQGDRRQGRGAQGDARVSPRRWTWSRRRARVSIPDISPEAAALPGPARRRPRGHRRSNGSGP